MFKMLNLIALLFIATSFFLIKKEIDAYKAKLQQINLVITRLESLESKLNDYEIKFKDEKAKNEDFKKHATTFMLNTVKALHNNNVK